MLKLERPFPVAQQDSDQLADVFRRHALEVAVLAFPRHRELLSELMPSGDYWMGRFETSVLAWADLMRVKIARDQWAQRKDAGL